MTALTQSYVYGASEKPLLGETIGQFFDAACADGPDRPALVVRHQQVRMSYGELKEAVDRLAAGLLTLGLQSGRSHRHLVAEQQRVGAHPIRDRQGRAHPGQHQSGLSRRRA